MAKGVVAGLMRCNLRVHNRVFHTLDLMRGIAAAFVLLAHGGFWTGGAAFMAVDLFFCLSGFVIAHAYDATLPGTAGFMKKRLIRLYPLFILGLLLGGMAEAAKIAFEYPTALEPGQLVVSLAAGSIMLPSPVTVGLFPANPPSWSVLFELGVNLLYGVFFTRLSSRVLLAVLCASALGVIYAIATAGTLSVGHAWSDVLLGIPRVVFPFTAGVLLYRHGVRLSWLGWWAPCVALAVVLGVIPPGSLTEGVIALCVVPLLVAWGAGVEPRFVRTARTVGVASYSIYILHYPLIQAAGYLTDSKAVMGVVLAAFVAGCCVLDRMYDAPIRRALRTVAS
jgi:peptidoglycan/LPS O-acetylase OafA/YrhL